MLSAWTVGSLCPLSALKGKDENEPLCARLTNLNRRFSDGSNDATNLSEPSWSFPPAWGVDPFINKSFRFSPGRLHVLQPLCSWLSPAGTVVVGMQINSSIMQPVSNAWSRHLSFFFSLSTSNGVLFRLKWESPCQCHHLLKNDETDWRMRPGWYSCLKARGLINLSGVAHVGIKLRLKLSWRRRRWR